MSRIVEGRLTLDFDESWTVSKYDDCREYIDIVSKLGNTKAIDIIGLKSNELYLIEVKDYGGKEAKFLDECEFNLDKLTTPLIKKISDTIFGCAKIQRNLKENQDFWRSVNHKFVENDPLHLIFWLDGDLGKTSSKFKKSQILQTLKRRLQNLSATVMIINSQDDSILPNVTFQYNDEN